jgi:pantothenate kinase-related protein Tda10
MSEGSQVNSIDFGKKRVVELFEDNSFPPMVLVDGKWGSGKTHYVYNELFPHLNKKYSSSSCHMMSLY